MLFLHPKLILVVACKFEMLLIAKLSHLHVLLFFFLTTMLKVEIEIGVHGTKNFFGRNGKKV